MSSIEQLKRKTEEFFKLHWVKDLPVPEWSNPWNFEGDIPNNDQPGCYALLRDNKLIYIGVGASQGSGIYIDMGIGSRLHDYWRMNKENPRTCEGLRRYIPNPDLGYTYDNLITIGLGKYGYLSYALEIYLIRNLHPQPEINTIGKKA